MHRRTFIKNTAAATGSLMIGSALAAQDGARPSRPLGLQLYTVMAALEQDFEGTLKQVADIGYTEVETIGSFGRDPIYVRDMFQKYGLTSPSQHMVPGDLYNVFKRLVNNQMTFDAASKHWRELMSVERVEAVMAECIASAKALGQSYVCWQILWKEQMATRALMERFCKALDRAGQLSADAGLTLNFHNHADEFERHDGIVPYDFLLEHTDPRHVKLELDMFWTVKAGRDPRELFERHPGRYLQCHLKDGTAAGKITVVGAGIVQFEPLLNAARAAGVKHYYVEQDGAANPLQASTQAYNYLRSRL